MWDNNKNKKRKAACRNTSGAKLCIGPKKIQIKYLEKKIAYIRVYEGNFSFKGSHRS